MTMPNADLAPLKYGKVKGRFLSVIGDVTDPDSFPDAVPLAGTVRFTASTTALLVFGAVPDPATVVPSPVTVHLDDNGYMSLNSILGVWLLAPSADTNPMAWTWHVEFNLTLASVPVPYTGFDFNLSPYLTDADIVDLALAARIPEGNPVGIVRGPQGDKGDTGLKGDPGQAGNSYQFTQSIPASVWNVPHGLHRPIVIAAVYSSDYSIQWTGFTVEPVDSDNCRLSFDDPISGIATIF